MSWALTWGGKPLTWTVRSDDKMLPDCEESPELSAASLATSVEGRRNIIHLQSSLPLRESCRQQGRVPSNRQQW